MKAAAASDTESVLSAETSVLALDVLEDASVVASAVADEVVLEEVSVVDVVLGTLQAAREPASVRAATDEMNWRQ